MKKGRKLVDYESKLTILFDLKMWHRLHHHSTNSYEPITFLQTNQNRLINIHRKSLKHISQSTLFGFGKNIGHDQIWYENSVVFKAVQWLFMIKYRGPPHHHSTNSYEPIRFLQTSQNRLINIHRNSLKHISQSALLGFGKNIGHDQIWYENSVCSKLFNDCSWLKIEGHVKLCYIVDSSVKTLLLRYFFLNNSD